MGLTKENCLSLIIQLSIIIFFFIIVEVTLLFFFDYSHKIKGSIDCKKFNKEFNFHYYKKNCFISEKHWENNTWIEYNFNQYGRREFNLFPYQEKIAIFGDSFTAGVMVNIEDNFNYYAINNLLKNKKTLHNYGVAAEEADNIFNKLHFYNLDEYSIIIYALTPNDFFDYLEKKTQFKSTYQNNFFDKLKKLLLSTATSRFLLHNLMSNDNIYFKTYMSRKPYSGYLNKTLNPEWINALEIFESNILKLPLSVKKKFNIFLLPQRAEVIATRLGVYDDAFRSKIKEICLRNKINCAFSNLNNLAKIKNSHFAVDGHLTIEGNKFVANDFAIFINNF